MTDSDLVEKVTRAMLAESPSGQNADRMARAAIAAVLDDLESYFPWNASLGGAIRTKRRELGL